MIQDIVTEINSSIRECLNIENSVYYGLAQTIEVNNERYPITRNEDGRLIKICPNDKTDLQIFHKINRDEFTFRNNDDYSFGRNKTYQIEANGRMVVVLKSAINLVSPTYNPLNFARVIPEKVILDDYKDISIEFNTVSTSHDAIVNREWKRIDYSKHKCKFFVFEVNYTIRALTCKLACTSFLLLEDGEYKVLQEDGSFILL